MLNNYPIRQLNNPGSAFNAFSLHVGDSVSGLGYIYSVDNYFSLYNYNTEQQSFALSGNVKSLKRLYKASDDKIYEQGQKLPKDVTIVSTVGIKVYLSNDSAWYAYSARKPVSGTGQRVALNGDNSVQYNGSVSERAYLLEPPDWVYLPNDYGLQRPVSLLITGLTTAATSRGRPKCPRNGSVYIQNAYVAFTAGNIQIVNATIQWNLQDGVVWNLPVRNDIGIPAVQVTTFR
jgi:hypothetical protein